MSAPPIPSLPPLSGHWNDMPVDHNITIRPPKRPAPTNYSDRAQARMIRQKLLEQEQEIEDLEALKVTAVRCLSRTLTFLNPPFPLSLLPLPLVVPRKPTLLIVFKSHRKNFVFLETPSPLSKPSSRTSMVCLGIHQSLARSSSTGSVSRSIFPPLPGGFNHYINSMPSKLPSTTSLTLVTSPTECVVLVTLRVPAAPLLL